MLYDRIQKIGIFKFTYFELYNIEGISKSENTL